MFTLCSDGRNDGPEQCEAWQGERNKLVQSLEESEYVNHLDRTGKPSSNHAGVVESVELDVCLRFNHHEAEDGSRMGEAKGRATRQPTQYMYQSESQRE